MNSSIELQKQVKDNAEDLRCYLSDLASWAGAMNSPPGEIKSRSSVGDKSIPPIRNHTKKRESNDKAGSIAGSKVSKRISSFNYDEWEKFDVEKACKEIDRNEEHGSSEKPNLKAQDEAQYEKERGNRFVKNGKWDDAIICYSKAIKCYSKDATFYANRALCYLKKKDFRSVEADCTTALQLEADYVKALQRRAAARRELNQLEDALKDLNKALILEPDNTALKADLALVKQRLSPKGNSEPKITQEKELLKWAPPTKVGSGSSATSTSSSTSKTMQKSSIDSPPHPVVIEPAKKHQKSGHVSVGEDVKTLLEAQVVEQKGESTKNEPTVPPEVADITSSIKWFNKEGLTVVQPIVKPPHRRSKVTQLGVLHGVTLEQCCEISRFKDLQTQEPLNRLPIRECPNYNLNADIESALQEMKVEKVESSRSNDQPEVVEKLHDEKPVEKCPPELHVNDADLPVPSTSVQFIATWKLIQNKPRLCFEFLKKISADELHKIFQDCLESDILSGIISILEGEYIKENVPVYDYLLGLSKVRRFSMLAMFLSATDKRGLQKLFDHCLAEEGRSEELVNNLKKIYEM